jgi:hypothetical protein
MQFMRGECKRSAADCRFSHAAKMINSVVAAVGVAQQKGFVVSSAPPNQPAAQAVAGYALSPPPGVLAIAAAPVQPNASTLSWIRPAMSAVFSGPMQSFAPSVAAMTEAP